MLKKGIVIGQQKDKNLPDHQLRMDGKQKIEMPEKISDIIDLPDMLDIKYPGTKGNPIKVKFNKIIKEANLCFARSSLNYYVCKTETELIAALIKCGCKDIIIKKEQVIFDWKWSDYTVGRDFPEITADELQFPCYLVNNQSFIKIFTAQKFEENYIIII